MINRHSARLVLLLVIVLAACTNNANSPTTVAVLPTSTVDTRLSPSIIPVHTPTLTPVPSAIPSPSPSPKPRLVASGRLFFVANTDSCQSTLYTINADGSMLMNLNGNLNNIYGPSWSPDGQKIVFLSDPDGTTWQVFVMNYDGSNLKQVTQLIDDFDKGLMGAFGPAMSPDGKLIAFGRHTRNGPHLTGYSDIFMIRADGTGLYNLTHYNGTNAWHKWSPDGKYIAYISGRWEGTGLKYRFYIMQPNGEGNRALSPPQLDPVAYGAPAWSPDSKWIAFNSEQDGYLYAVSIDGKKLNKLTNQCTGNGPIWSPDGTRIACINDNRLLYTVNTDGTHLTMLRDDVEWTVSPSWSPDSKWIAFEPSSALDQPREIHIIGADGLNEYVLVSDLSNQCGIAAGDTSWQP